MRKIELGKTGELIPILGQGTWGIKKFRGKKYYEDWKNALRKGIELGITHIDTAEIYGQGTSEKLVGEIISEYNREDLFITSKLFPIHLSYRSMKKATFKSLKRLGIEYKFNQAAELSEQKINEISDIIRKYNINVTIGG